jgi:hypothetical protein
MHRTLYRNSAFDFGCWILITGSNFDRSEKTASFLRRIGMQKTDPNDSAGPTNSLVFPNNGGVVYGQNGLTKREYFAAMALPGIYHYYNRKDLAPISVEQAAMVARQAADALIEELNK